MKAQYPPGIPLSGTYTIQPASNAARTRAAANGRIYVQHLTSFDDATVTLEHSWISKQETLELLEFWEQTRNDEITWEDTLGRAWDAEFVTRPIVKGEEGGYHWTVSVTLSLRRPDQ